MGEKQSNVKKGKKQPLNKANNSMYINTRAYIESLISPTNIVPSHDVPC